MVSFCSPQGIVSVMPLMQSTGFLDETGQKSSRHPKVLPSCRIESVGWWGEGGVEVIFLDFRFDHFKVTFPTPITQIKGTSNGELGDKILDFRFHVLSNTPLPPLSHGDL